MHIAHVMEATIGGTRRHLVDVAHAQLLRGDTVSLLVSTLRDPGFAADLVALEAAGATVRRIPMVRAIRPARDLVHLRRIKAALRELRPDVVHTHSSKAGVLGRRASLSTGIGARVHTPHTFAFLFGAMFGRAKRAVFRSIERSLASSTHRLVAVSESEAATIAASGVVDPGRLCTVPNGIDPARVEGAEPANLAGFGLDAARPVAAVVGLLYSAKGQDLALEALAEEGLEGLQLLFVGPGDQGPLLELAARLGVQRRVAFTGPRDDVPSILAASDFLVLPSRWEGMPYVVLEAMAASRAVVSTPVDGARDLVEDDVTGFLASGVSGAALAAAMRRAVLAGSGRRERLGAAGRARLDGAHDVSTMAERLDAVYREALGASGKP